MFLISNIECENENESKIVENLYNSRMKLVNNKNVKFHNKLILPKT